MPAGPEDALAKEVKRGEIREITAEGVKGLVVENMSGYLEVRGEERADIQLEIQYRVRSRKAERAERALSLLTLAAVRDGEWLRLGPRYDSEVPAGRVEELIRRVSVRIDILALVPEDIALEASVSSGDLKVLDLARGVQITTTSGDVEASRIEGYCDLSLTSGDLFIEDLTGDLTVHSTSGDVELRRVGGDVRVHSISGDVRAEKVGGGLNAQSNSGDLAAIGIEGDVTLASNSGSVLVEDAQGLLRANTSNGDITVLGAGHPGQALHLASSSGEIEVYLRQEASFYIDLNTTLGGIRCRLPLSIEDVSRRHLAGRMGGGESPLHVVTASGDIRIELMEE